jgi:PAS domain-containing protein
MAGFAAHLGGSSTSIETECRLRDKSGDWCWVSNRGGVVERNGDDSARRATGSHLDITRRQQAESNNAFLEAPLRQQVWQKC